MSPEVGEAAKVGDAPGGDIGQHPAEPAARLRVGQWVSAGSCGTLLVLAALAVIDADDVSTGLGWS